ncbi:MAG: GldG family protein [Clostridia bacterium]|nr:GldG family protein [Clostridia bacterium]
MNKIIERIKGNWIKDSGKTILLILILIIIFIVINLVIQKLDLQDIDITKNKIYTLSEESKKQIENIESSVKIYLIGFNENTNLIDLVKQYQKQNKNIDYELIEDIQSRVDIKYKYGIEEETQVIIVEANERNKIITINELYTYDYTTFQQIDTSEEKITNAILNVTIDKKPKIYFLTGHKEYSLNTQLTVLSAYLQNEMNEVETLDLVVKDTIPEDAKVLVIASPQVDFSDRETQIIIEYINKGGKILWLNDPTLKGEKYANIEKILDLFGVKFDDGVILEQDTNKMIAQTPDIIIPNVITTEITKDIATDGGVMLISSGKLTILEDEKLEELNIESQAILTTSENALFRTDLTNASTTKSSSDKEGSFVLGAKLTKTIEDNKSTMYILANNLFITDFPVTVNQQQAPAIYFKHNKDLILNIIAELADNKDIISIRKDTGVVTYTATQNQDTIIKIVIFTIPVIIIFIGILVWQSRRRKK